MQRDPALWIEHTELLEWLELGITSLETEISSNYTRQPPELILGELHSVADCHATPVAGDDNASPRCGSRSSGRGDETYVYYRNDAIFCSAWWRSNNYESRAIRIPESSSLCVAL